MVYTVRLATGNTDFNVMGKAGLRTTDVSNMAMVYPWSELTLIAACSDLPRRVAILVHWPSDELWSLWISTKNSTTSCHLGCAGLLICDAGVLGKVCIPGKIGIEWSSGE